MLQQTAFSDHNVSKTAVSLTVSTGSVALLVNLEGIVSDLQDQKPPPEKGLEAVTFKLERGKDPDLWPALRLLTGC